MPHDIRFTSTPPTEPAWYRARCSCGWVSRQSRSPVGARIEAEMHLVDDDRVDAAQTAEDRFEVAVSHEGCVDAGTIARVLERHLRDRDAGIHSVRVSGLDARLVRARYRVVHDPIVTSGVHLVVDMDGDEGPVVVAVCADGPSAWAVADGLAADQ